MDQKPLNLAIVGCGNIARAYGKSLQPYPQLKLLGATDHVLKLAEDYVATFGGKVYPSLEALLADEEIDLVINLTIHRAHMEVITKCLNAGKDVYSEKRIALTSEEAWKLVTLAQEKGRRFGCAPITILGEGQQTAWKAIRDDLLGTECDPRGLLGGERQSFVERVGVQRLRPSEHRCHRLDGRAHDVVLGLLCG